MCVIGVGVVRLPLEGVSKLFSYDCQPLNYLGLISPREEEMSL